MKIGNAPAGNELIFSGMKSGKLLLPMAGYPSTFPQLQITQDERFCFWDWPTTFAFTGGGIGLANAIASDFHIVRGNDVPVSVAGYSLDGSPWFVDPNHQFVHLVPAVPDDEKFFNEFTGTKTRGGVLCPLGGMFNVVCYSYQGKVYYQPIAPFVLVFMNIQYYLNGFFYAPYNVWSAVAYGKSYPQLLYEQFASKDAVKNVGTYCSNVNFFLKPESKLNFWDYVLLGAPVAISVVATVISSGAATPALIAALSGLVGSVATKAAIQKYKEAEMLANQDEGFEGMRDENIIPGGAVNSGQTVNKNFWLLLLIGLGGVVLLTKKRRK